MKFTFWLVSASLSCLLAGIPAAPADASPFFETRVLLAAGDYGMEQHCYPSVATLPDGRLFLVWTAQTEKPRIVGALSSDNGATRSTPEELMKGRDIHIARFNRAWLLQTP